MACLIIGGPKRGACDCVPSQCFGASGRRHGGSRSTKRARVRAPFSHAEMAIRRRRPGAWSWRPCRRRPGPRCAGRGPPEPCAEPRGCRRARSALPKPAASLIVPSTLMTSSPAVAGTSAGSDSASHAKWLPIGSLEPLDAFSRRRRLVMSDTKGKGSHAARRANAAATREGKSNPRKSSAAQAILGRKGAKSK